MSAKPWDDAPACPYCAGPSHDVDPEQCDGKNLQCLWCDAYWSGTGTQVDAAERAESAWRMAHYGGPSWQEFERGRKARDRAKYERAMRGEW